jgi:uncharacterized protein (DUF302 family)
MNSIIQAVVWVLAGMVLMGLIVWFAMPFLMLIRYKSKLNYEETVTALSETLDKKQDWRMLTVNDYQKSTEAFAALEKVSSVSICNPRYAAKILTNDKNRGVTAFMPLGLGVYEDKKGNEFVSQLNVSLLGMMFGGTIAKVMGMAGKDIRAVVKSVAAE